MGTRRNNIPTLQLVTDATIRQRESVIEPARVSLTVKTDNRVLLTVAEAARRLEIGRSLFYELLAAGEIESIHVGRLRRVPAETLADYVAKLRTNRSDPGA